MNDKKEPQSLLDQHLRYLKLSFMQNHHQDLAAQASKKHWSHVDYLEKLADGEAAMRRDRSIERRIRLARFPVIKTLDQFNCPGPKKSTASRSRTSSGLTLSKTSPIVDSGANLPPIPE